MKKVLLLSLVFFIGGCAGCTKDEKEDYQPYPGGKSSEKPMKSQ